MTDYHHPFAPEEMGRPTMIRSLDKLEVQDDMPGHVRIRRTWLYRGVVCYGEAMCNGKPVPLFKTAERSESTSWEVVTVESLAVIRRIWMVN